LRVDLPLIRKSDRRNVGELTLIRAMNWQFVDDGGNRLATPKQQDTLIVSLKNAAGEEICWHTVPMDQLALDT
jgi:hypothetical protein